MIIGNENDNDIKTSKHDSWFSIAEDLSKQLAFGSGCVCHEFGSCVRAVAMPLLVALYTSPQYFDMMQIVFGGIMFMLRNIC